MRFIDIAPKLFPAETRDSIAWLAEDFRTLDAEEFFDRYPDLLIDYEDSADFEEECRTGVIGLSTLIVWTMVDQGILLQLDWEGEEEEGVLAGFLEYRLEGMDDRVIRLDAEPLYEKFREDAAAECPQLQLGQHLPLLFRYLNAQLLPYGYRMLCFDANCDQYYIGVFPLNEAKHLLALKIDDIMILDVDDFDRNSTD